MSEMPSSVFGLPSSVPEPTIDIRLLTTDLLQEKLTLRTKQLCQNSELSSHLVDLMMREVEAIQDELYLRRNTECRKWIFAQLAHLSELITVDAVMHSEYSYKYVKAQEFLNLMMNRAVNQEDFSLLLTQWLHFGGTARLRDQILPPLGYQNDYIPDFNVMVLLDDIGIGYREKLTAVAGKTAMKKRIYKEWRTPEIQFLKAHFATKKAWELAKELGRTRCSVRDMAYSIGLRKNKIVQISPEGKQLHVAWTAEEELFFRENFTKMKAQDLALVLNRSVNSIQCKARDLKLKKEPPFLPRKAQKKSPEGTAALAGSDVGFMIADL